MDLQQRIDKFLEGTPHAIVGASIDRSKYGNKVLRAYLQSGRDVHPVNLTSDRVEGRQAYRSLMDIPTNVHGVSIITPPAVTESVVEEAGQLGIKHLWMQPGAESATAIQRAQELGMNVIAGGPCVLVTLRFREQDPD
jgi:predicted CoA-binding protein